MKNPIYSIMAVNEKVSFFNFDHPKFKKMLIISEKVIILKEYESSMK